MLRRTAGATVDHHRSTIAEEIRMTSTAAVPTTIEAAWHASGAALYAGDIDAFLAHWQPDGRYEVAYPVAGLPPVVAGHAALRELFASLTSLAASIRVDDVRFHPTADPDVAFVEEHMTAELHDGGRYENDLCLRVTFRDGRIASIFEYYGERAHEQLVQRARGLKP
jgi:ketosteroid isomerase-like protein